MFREVQTHSLIFMGSDNTTGLAAMFRFLIVFLMLLFVSGRNALAEERGCQNDKRVMASCFDVQGTIMVHANLRAYLHEVKSGKSFALAFKTNEPDSQYFVPRSLLSRLGPDKDVYGHFVVCPLSKEAKGRQQTVCISDVVKLLSAKPNEGALFHAAETESEKWLDNVLRQPERVERTQSNAAGRQKSDAFFSKELQGSWRKREEGAVAKNCGGSENEGELCGLDFDPLICAQDDNDGQYLYRTESQAGGVVHISMRWKESEDISQALALYRIVRKDKRWMIDGIKCHHGEQFNMR